MDPLVPLNWEVVLKVHAAVDKVTVQFCLSPGTTAVIDCRMLRNRGGWCDDGLWFDVMDPPILEIPETPFY